jgi:uncharacterized membrane protein YgcG
MNLIVSTLVIVGLLFGGSATVAAAQDDLPNQSLYQLKLMSENVNLWFVSDPAQQINMLMEQAQTRIQEMESLASQGIVPPAEVAVQAQERIQRALQIAAQMDEASQQLALQQIRARLQTQEQQMLHLQQGACTECDPMLQQTREMLQLRLRDVEGSLATPPANQNQNQNQNQYQNQFQTTQTPQPTDEVTVSNGTCTPALDGTGQQNGGGNTSAATPMQQNNQNNQNENGGQNGTGSGDGSGSPSGSGDGNGSSSGSGGGQGGKP